MKRYTEHSSSSVNDMGLENRQKPVPSKLTVSATKRVVTNRTEDEEVLRRCKEKLDLFRDMNGKRFYKTDKFLK